MKKENFIRRSERSHSIKYKYDRVSVHHDWLKRKYAREHSINLEVVSYKDKNKIPKILEEILKKYPEN